MKRAASPGSSVDDTQSFSDSDGPIFRTAKVVIDLTQEEDYVSQDTAGYISDVEDAEPAPLSPGELEEEQSFDWFNHDLEEWYKEQYPDAKHGRDCFCAECYPYYGAWDSSCVSPIK